MLDEIKTCPNCGSEDLEDVSENLCVCKKCNTMAWLEDGKVQTRLAEKIQTMKATADRSSGILKVKCPGCEFVNEFSELGPIDIFICEGCEEPVEVVEKAQ